MIDTFTNTVLFAMYGFDEFLHVNLIDFGFCIGSAIFGNIG